MLLLPLLCVSLSAVLCADLPLPAIPDEFSAQFMCTSRDSEYHEEVYVGEVYYSKKLNKGAFVANMPGNYIEHLVLNYNTDEALATSEQTVKRCTTMPISEVYVWYNPKVMLSLLSDANLKYVTATNTFGDIPGNIWKGKVDRLNETVIVTYNVEPWTFPNSYTSNVSRPISLSTLVRNEGKNDTIGEMYFFGVTDHVPDEVFMPPGGLFCPNFHDATGKPPTLPIAFRVDAEVYKEDSNYGSKTFYNGNAKVYREDIITDHHNRHSMVVDRKYGIMYMIEDSGVCTSLPVLQTSEKSPAGLLLFDNDNIENFKFIGNRTCWQGECEVYSGAKDGFLYNLYLKHSPHSLAADQPDSQYAPIQMNINWNGLSQEESSTQRQYYYNFEPGYPPWDKFDVTNCYMELRKLRFQVVFQGSYLGIASIPEFERKFRVAVMQLTQIPEMRMHKFRVDNMLNEFVVVTLTLVEDPRLAHINGTFSDSSLLNPTLNFDVYLEIQKAVYSDRFKVITKANDGKEITFIGTSTTRRLLSEKNIDGKGAALAKFKIKGNLKISITEGDTTIGGPTTLDECARECDAERHSSCNMFMYNKRTQTCVLSETSYTDRTDKQFASNCDLYERNFAFDYQLYSGYRLFLDNATDDVVTGESLESCFSHCRNKTNGTGCHSIDYCSSGPKRTCVYHAKHILQDPRAVTDQQCLHYSQIFLRMYRSIPGKSIEDAASKYTDIQYDVSATECAQNCFLDPAGCIDFEMCTPFPGTKVKTVCHVLEAKKLSTNNEKPKFIKNTDCDHYRLIGAKTEFNLDANPTNGPVGPTPSAVKSSGSEYGSGSMAALGIVMLLIAIAAGGGAVYFYVRRQKLRGDDSNFILKFVQ